jgi:sigma-B regulation protein RsbU (phosphoserine phosphatase)
MKFPFGNGRTAAPKPALKRPLPIPAPKLDNSHVAALYREARKGGDFFDFVALENSRLIFLLLDIAGERAEAMHIAAQVQETFRERAHELFATAERNEADAVAALLIELNRGVLQAADGVRCTPGFLGSYGEGTGVLFYVNAGHTPALLRDSTGILALEATALPMGLFSHATADAHMSVLSPGAVLMLTSRGIVESRKGRKEFGIERVRAVMETNPGISDASRLCQLVLESVAKHTHGAAGQNDLTTLAIARNR